jgi:hypothetical protein
MAVKCLCGIIARLKDTGKTPNEIVLALIRKIIAITRAVLKSQIPCNPDLHAN